MIFPAGSTLDCPTCGRKLARLKVERQTGDIAHSKDFERIDAVNEITPQGTIDCPDHGPLHMPVKPTPPLPDQMGE